MIAEELTEEDEDSVRTPSVTSVKKNDIISKKESKEAKESDSMAQNPMETTQTVKSTPVEATSPHVTVAQEQPGLPNIHAWRSNSLNEEPSGVNQSEENAKRSPKADTNIEVVGRSRHACCTIC